MRGTRRASHCPEPNKKFLHWRYVEEGGDD